MATTADETHEAVRAIIREIMKYDSELLDILCCSDMEGDKEYSFDANEAWKKLAAFAKGE